ncbi:MAG: hypothetical protein RSF90_00615 [Pygmaiobacter sp.]
MEEELLTGESAAMEEISPDVQENAELLPETENAALQQMLEEFGKSELAALREVHGVSAATLAELEALPGGERMVQLWRGGVPLADAYAVANISEITRRETAWAKQAALNAVYGKAHLAKTSGTATSEVTVPAAVYEQYRAMMPNWSDAKIQKNYQSYKTKGEM